MLAIRVAPIDIAVAVTVDNLISVHENQMRSVRLLLYALRQRVLLVAEDDRLFASGRPLASTHGRVRDDLLAGVLLFEPPCRVHSIDWLGLA